MAFQLEGRLLEVCNCNVLCPCWIGEDPDNGTCDAIVAWHIDKGTVDGLDVSGRTFATLNYIPGNILQGNQKVAAFVDEEATDEHRPRRPQRHPGTLQVRGSLIRVQQDAGASAPRAPASC